MSDSEILNEQVEAVIAEAEAPSSSDDSPLYTKEQVDELIRAEREAATRLTASKVKERTQKKLEARYLSEIENLKAQATQETPGTVAVKSEAEILAIFNKALDQREAQAQEAYEQAETERYARKAQQILDQKLDEAKASNMYPNFGEVIKDYPMDRYKAPAFLATEFENSAAIIYEMAQNVDLRRDINNLLAEGDYAGARQKMRSLDSKFSQNAQGAALHGKQTQEPLSRSKSSPSVGHSDDMRGKSLDDFERAMAKWY